MSTNKSRRTKPYRKPNSKTNSDLDNCVPQIEAVMAFQARLGQSAVDDCSGVFDMARSSEVWECALS